MRWPLAAAAAAVALAAVAEAASFALDEGELRRAVALGERSATTDTAFDTEWRVTNATGEVAVVVTPFHRIALAARHAAFKKEALTAPERDKILREQKDRLTVWVLLRGPREDFARHYAPRFIVTGPGAAEREILPSFVQNERTALKQDGGIFHARCVYGFPVKEITGASRGALVVRDADGQEVSRFAVDLSRMR
jgi:hypothetical protein